MADNRYITPIVCLATAGVRILYGATTSNIGKQSE